MPHQSRNIFGLLFLMTFLCGISQAQTLPPEASQFMERFQNKMKAYQSNSGFENLGYLTGLWKVGGGEDASNIEIIQITHIKDLVAEFIVDTKTGRLSQVGFAEKKGNLWAGWFALACRGCCPGKGWWDRGVLVFNQNQKVLHLRSDTKKMDPDKCVLTNKPDVVDFKMKIIQALWFKEIRPGKLIHIVAAPQIGNHPAQYKASVTLQWDITGFGVDNITLVGRGPGQGQYLLNASTQKKGQYEFLTDRSGKYQFLFMAKNQNGQVLHFELKSIEIPAIPGIGR